MKVIRPSWHAPSQIQSFTTEKSGGASHGAYHSLNLALHVGDNAHHVMLNRQSLIKAHLPYAPIWLNQVHSNRVVKIEEDFNPSSLIDADALYTQVENQPLAIMTADCLPLFLCSDNGKEVAVVHAGWRGLKDGIIENTLKHFSVKLNTVHAHLGPAISQNAFEVGQDVYESFISSHAHYQSYFHPLAQNGKYLCDLYAIAKDKLAVAGVCQISGGDYCTFNEPERFFSYRRDGICGRNAHLIWIKK